jgi:hypothetical protein
MFYYTQILHTHTHKQMHLNMNKGSGELKMASASDIYLRKYIHIFIYSFTHQAYTLFLTLWYMLEILRKKYFPQHLDRKKK